MKLVEGRATVDDVEAFVERLTAIGTERDTIVQAFDARLVAGHRHLEAAARAAERARDHDDAIADDPAVEVLLYAAGRRQIDQALELGISPGEGSLVVLVDADDRADEEAVAEAVEARLVPAETLGVARDDKALREYFDVTDTEFEATDASLEDLIVERVALLAVEK